MLPMRGPKCLTAAAFLCLASISHLLSPPTAKAQTYTWTIEDIDLQGAGSSIVADQEGNLHLSYYFPEGGQMKYAFRPAGSSKWFKMTLERNLGVLETGITLDSAGNPHICYTPRIMKYAHWDGRKWFKQEVDPGSGLIAYICSIQVTPQGNPMISWYLETGTNLRYAILQNDVWMARSIDGNALPGKWSSIALDAKGLPRISFSHFPIGQLKYASFDGKVWSISTVDAPDPDRPALGGQRGMGNSLALDPQGNPLISYYEEQSLKLARFVNGKWQKETVEELPPFGKWGWKSFRSSLILDNKVMPHIGFESLQGLEHAWWDGTKWRTQLLVRSIGNSVYENAMTKDKDDTLYITFKNPADGSFKLAIGRPGPSTTAVGAEKVSTSKER